MLVLLKHELKQNYKSMLIWSLSVGLMGMFCICLYSSMTEDMSALSDSFSNMGAFSDAFGMSTLGIGTIAGYFATEVGVVHSLGSAMFAAVISTTILSKEEDGHTGEFLYSLPISRGKVVVSKLIALIIMLIVFTVIAIICYLCGFIYIEDHPDWNLFIQFMSFQFMMNIEIMLICMTLSAFAKKNMPGAGLGIALLFYAIDLIGRVSSDVKDAIAIGPFSYCNASEIFAKQELPKIAYVFAVIIMFGALAIIFKKYTNKDLAS